MSALISLRGVSMVFNEQAAVDNLSLSVEPGEVLALLGQTGAGKSTVLNLILGQIRPTAGTVIGGRSRSVCRHGGTARKDGGKLPD